MTTCTAEASHCNYKETQMIPLFQCDSPAGGRKKFLSALSLVESKTLYLGRYRADQGQLEHFFFFLAILALHQKPFTLE